MQRDIHLERHYPHSPERVWRALTDPRRIQQWMQMETDFQPQVGARFELRDISGNWDGTLSCEVTHCEPPIRLAYTFIGGQLRRETLVTFTLVPQDGGTRLVLEHTGFTGFPDLVFSGIIGLGWRRMLRDLSLVHIIA